MPPQGLYVVWANIPTCARVAAELWVGRDCTGIVLFIDDADDVIRVELLPAPGQANPHILGLAETERVIAEAKRELMAMGGR